MYVVVGGVDVLVAVVGGWRCAGTAELLSLVAMLAAMQAAMRLVVLL